MPASVTIGYDIETRQKIEIGDVERQGGLYISGKPRTGKSSVLVNLAVQDANHGHGFLFIDPHDDAINELLVRIPGHRRDDVLLLDPTDKTHAFSVNVLACADPTNLMDRNITFSSALDIFIKLFPNPQTGLLDILLSKYLRNSFIPMIEVQGYTLADIPLYLTDKPFRESLLRKVTYNPEVVEFWHREFEQLRSREKSFEIESTLNRLNPLLTRDYTKFMVSQAENTVDFSDWMDSRKIILLRLPAWLDDEMKSFIGTILVSQLLKAVFLRSENPPQERIPFGLYCDEFHLVASPDFAKLFTQTGKFNIMPTVAHQERLGQLKPFDPNLGATLAAVLKVLFSQAVHDADELAPELAKLSPTEVRLERRPGISQQPFKDLLLGHHHPDIHRFVQQYLLPLYYELEDTEADMKGEELLHRILIDAAAVSRVDYTAARDARLPEADSALYEAQGTLLQASEHAQNLMALFESARGQRLSIRSLNRFLTAIMEGRITPESGDELFSQFLLAFVRLSAWVPQQAIPAFEVYISLVYGNPHMPRPVPMSLGAKYLGVKHEELYREVEAQYTRQVSTSAERQRLILNEIKGDQYQDHYERALKQIMTWKHDVPRWTVNLSPLLRYREVRAFVTPYLFAKFAPPWYYNHPAGRPHWAYDYEDYLDEPEEQRPFREFVRQYGEGAAVVEALLAAACGHRAENNNHVLPRNFGPPKTLSLWGVEQTVPWLGYGYPSHLHMMELPAIVGMEPFQVWQVVRQLNDLLYNLAVPNGQYWSRTLTRIGHRTYCYPLEPLSLDVRIDAQFLMAKIEGDDEDFPDAAQLRSWWPQLTAEDIRVIGRRRALLAWKVGNYYIKEGAKARGEVRQRLREYKDEKRSIRKFMHAQAQLKAGEPREFLMGYLLSEDVAQYAASDMPLPYELARVWRGLDEQTQTYLIARACDSVCYGDVIADRTFPQPTLPGIPTQQVSVIVTVLMALLLDAHEEINASGERSWQRSKEAFVERCLWEYDGLLRLQVYHYERRVRMRNTVERYLPPLFLTLQEQKTLTEGCLLELQANDGERALAELANWVQFCRLLRQPENHVKGMTAQYVEREVNTYSTDEMRKQIAQELINLPRYTAYATLMQEQGGTQVVRKVKIMTAKLPKVAPGLLPEAIRTARNNAIEAGILRPHSAIEAETKRRLAGWRRSAVLSPPPQEEPPPAKTGSISPPAQEESPKSVTPPTLYFESLKFFESGKDVLQKELHFYRLWFPKETTRFVYYEITARNPLYKQQDQNYTITTHYCKLDGTIVNEYRCNLAVKSEVKSFLTFNGSGWEDPGKWEPGDYRVVILINGTEFAKGSFKITKPRRRRK